VGEDPVLWKWCNITVSSGDDINKLLLGRFKYVEIILVDPDFDWSAQQLEQFLLATLELPKLKDIDNLEELDLKCVNSELLGRALGKLKNLVFNSSDHTTNDQRLAVFKEASKRECVELLILNSIDLRLLDLEEELLAKILSALGLLFILGASFTNKQVQEMFKSISKNNQLKKVSFSSLDVSSVEPETFGRAITNIWFVSLNSVQISRYQARALFTDMGRNSGIKVFSTTDINLSEVNPKLIERGLSKLEKVALPSSHLTTEQVQAIFAELKLNSQLDYLGLSENYLSSVNPDDLAAVVTNIAEVDLSDTQLNTEQITAVLTRVQQNSKLKSLGITGNVMDGVDLVLVTTAREILEELDIDTESEDEESDDDEILNENEVM